MANGSSIFIGTGVGLHINSIYGVPFIPTQTPRKPCINFTKKVDSTKVIDVFGKVLRIKRKTYGYPFINGGFGDDIWGSLSKQRVYSAQAWAVRNLEANTFATLPKFPWDKSGWKMFNKKPTINFRGLKCKVQK